MIAGKITTSSTAITPITTNNSIRVNALVRLAAGRVFILPIESPASTMPSSFYKRSGVPAERRHLLRTWNRGALPRRRYDRLPFVGFFIRRRAGKPMSFLPDIDFPEFATDLKAKRCNVDPVARSNRRTAPTLHLQERPIAKPPPVTHCGTGGDENVAANQMV